MTRIFILLGALALCAAAGAHHSPNVHFDRSDIVEIAGTLTEIEWRNPHTLLVVETVGGSGETLDQAIAVAARGGRVSILGLFTGAVAFNATATVMKEVTLYGGITYGRPGGRSDFEVAMEIAARYSEDLRRVITHRVELADIERGFATAADKSQGSIKVTVEV